MHISMKCTLLSRVDASPCYVTYGARNFHRRAKQIGFKALKLPTLNSCHEKHDARIEEKTWSCHDESKKYSIHQAKQTCCHSDENIYLARKTHPIVGWKKHVLTCYKQKLWNIVEHAFAKVLFKIDSAAMRSTLFSTSKRWKFTAFF